MFFFFFRSLLSLSLFSSLTKRQKQKKKTFVSISKYLVALIPNLEFESERWSSDLENEQISIELWEMFEREAHSSPFKWAEIFNKTAQFRKSTFSPKMTKAIQVCLFIQILPSSPPTRKSTKEHKKEDKKLRKEREKKEKN